MNEILQFFNISNTFFTVLGYPISYLEFIGTIFNLACVILVARKNILNWPVGLIGVILFGALFYQINLYADLFEQVYYFITGIWGWYMWQAAKKPKDGEERIVVTKNTAKTNLMWLGAIIIGTIIGTWAMSNIHTWLPNLFPENASLPLLDTATTAVSFVATILMMQRKVESWLLWIAVDVVAVWLYAYKQVPFIALLYLIFLGIAISGYITWRNTYRREHHETGTRNREILPAAQRA
jgi:nicotinamide mononucleotide transporter